MKARPDWAGLGGELVHQRAPQPALGRSGRLTEADVTGYCGGRRAQRELCGAAGAQRPPQDKASWAGVGAAETGRAGVSGGPGRGGKQGPRPRLRTPASPLEALAPSAGRR